MQPHRGALILVIGILGIVACAICAPFAWLMGKKDLEEMAAGRMDPAGKGLTQAGMYLGLIGTILMIIGFLFVIVWFVIGAAAIGFQQ